RASPAAAIAWREVPGAPVDDLVGRDPAVPYPQPVTDRAARRFAERPALDRPGDAPAERAGERSGLEAEVGEGPGDDAVGLASGSVGHGHSGRRPGLPWVGPVERCLG